MQGVTDALIGLADAATAARDWRPALLALRQRHLEAARALLGDDADDLKAWLTAQFEQLSGLLQATAVLGARRGARPLNASRAWAKCGRRGCCGRTLCRAAPTARCSTRARCCACGTKSSAWPWTGPPAAASWRNGALGTRPRALSPPDSWPPAKHGLPTVLGRNGSDYSGAIFAALFEADELHIWTDVDGVLSADPRLVPEAVPLPALSYREACELPTSVRR